MRIRTWIVPTLLLTSSMAMAVSFPQFKQPPARSPNLTPLNCANFHGRWKGRCDTATNGKRLRSEKELDIEQYHCDRLRVDDLELALGGSTDVNTTSPQDSVLISVMASWNTNRDQIRIKSTLRGRSLDPTQNFLFVGYSDSTLTIEDDTLVEQSQLKAETNSDDQRPITTTTSERCTYSRSL